MASEPTTPNEGNRDIPDRRTVAPETDPLSRWIPKTFTGYGSLAAASAALKPAPADTPELPQPQQPADFRPAFISNVFSLEPLDPEPYDVLILCSNHVCLAVHSHKLIAASANRFCHRLPLSADARRAVSGEDAPYVLTLPEDSAVLNIVCHIIYGLSYAHCSPTLPILAAVIEALKTYAIPSTPHLAPGGSIYTFVLAQATSMSHTPEAFAFAVEQQLEDLAVAISPHMIRQFELKRMPDALASRIGGVYMMRLINLHQRRHSAMYMLMKAPSFPHAPGPQCTLVDRQELTCDWMLRAAKLVWNHGPGLIPDDMEDSMSDLHTAVCSRCRESLTQQINEIVAKWALVTDTI